MLWGFFYKQFSFILYNACVMKLESNGILIGLRPFNERDAIAQIFSQDFGVVVGMLRGAVVAKKNKPLLGQYGRMVWNARLDSQLGTMHWDIEKNLSVALLMSPDKLSCMNAGFELLVTLLPERQAYQELYEETIRLMFGLASDMPNAYLNWEVALLRELGYALDLSRCSGCGTLNDLNYLSPRTARAVCDSCARPYLNKLYRLPVDLGVTGRFLESVCNQQGVNIPVMRKMLKLD